MDDKQEDHRKCNAPLLVFYLNDRSINPSVRLEAKISYIRQQIEYAKRPDIVAFVETWLTESTSDHAVLESLGLTDYLLYRRDRIDTNEKGKVRPGGGMIIAVKLRSGLSSRPLCSYNDNFMAIELTYTSDCSKCCGGNTTQLFTFGLVYRRKSPYTSGQTRDEFDDASGALWKEIHSFADDTRSISGSVLVGDFNFDISFELPEGRSKPDQFAVQSLKGLPMYAGCKQVITSRYERGLFDSLVTRGYQQRVEDQTHWSGNMLDLIFSKPSNFVANIKNLGNVSVRTDKQDHCILAFNLVCNKE